MHVTLEILTLKMKILYLKLVVKYFFAFLRTFTHTIQQRKNFRLFAKSYLSKITKNFFKKKNLVWHSHNFLLPYIIVEEYFINSIAFILNLYFICFVVDELPGFIIFIVYNF